MFSDDVANAFVGVNVLVAVGSSHRPIGLSAFSDFSSDFNI
jgi:hypothetical protein